MSTVIIIGEGGTKAVVRLANTYTSMTADQQNDAKCLMEIFIEDVNRLCDSVETINKSK